MVLRHNIAASGLANIDIAPVAAGRIAGKRDFFVRGARSAVNSLFPNSRYASVTSVLRVPVMRLDDLVNGAADVVKIDVEGAELEVLEGMPRILSIPRVALIVEWDPLLQRMAGYSAGRLAALVSKAGVEAGSRLPSDGSSARGRRRAGADGSIDAGAPARGAVGSTRSTRHRLARFEASGRSATTAATGSAADFHPLSADHRTRNPRSVQRRLRAGSPPRRPRSRPCSAPRGCRRQHGSPVLGRRRRKRRRR